MIRVSPEPEYPAFDQQVRTPGNAFLADYPNPTSAQFKKKNYWSRAANELHSAYSGICAYTAVYLPELGSVDHFRPKTNYPGLTYEWSNYRLASGRVNSTKGNQEGIIDPFEVGDDWFHLDIPSCLLKPNPGLSRDLQTRIRSTINSLRLNDNDYYVQERCNILIAFAQSEIALNFVKRRYPFLAKEIERQDLLPEFLLESFRMS